MLACMMSVLFKTGCYSLCNHAYIAIDLWLSLVANITLCMQDLHILSAKMDWQLACEITEQDM